MMNDTDWEHRLACMIRTACVWEVTARKPGNVHPDAAFADACYQDFVRSADVAAPVLAKSARLGVGRAIRDAVLATNQAVGHNTNLGIILLIAPLASVPGSESLAQGIEATLAALTVEDARLCYEAIRASRPGGLGTATDQDVAAVPTVTLREAMRLAAGRDRIAAQYAGGFEDVLSFGLSSLDVDAIASDAAAARERAIIDLHLRLMAALPDTLIARKCGEAVARESAARAQQVIDAGGPHSAAGQCALTDLDHWLRADANRRNPGTTADLVAATLFAALREERIALSFEDGGRG